MTRLLIQNRKGVALTISIMMIICAAILGGYALQAGWNQQLLTKVGGSRRDKIYWAARAGVVDARWRIRNNIGGAFSTTPALDPAPYTLNIDGVGGNDVSVDIGPVGANGLRTIDSTGLDNLDFGAGAARQIRIDTFVPLPNGAFKQLDVTGVANGRIDLGTGANSRVSMGSGGSPITIGNTAVANRPLTVKSNNGLQPASIMGNNRFGVVMGGVGGANNYGLVRGQNNIGNETALYLNRIAGGTVNVGAYTASQSALQVVTNNAQAIGFTQGADPAGPLRYTYDTDGYYATYAP